VSSGRARRFRISAARAIRLSVALALAVWAPCGVEAAKVEQPYCPGFENITTRSKLPPALREFTDGVAMPGEDWNAGDVSDDKPFSGFGFIWKRGRFWVFQVGHGGIATWVELAIFKVSANGRTASRVMPIQYLGSYCDIARSYAKR
jgi:hypothetical protein